MPQIRVDPGAADVLFAQMEDRPAGHPFRKWHATATNPDYLRGWNDHPQSIDSANEEFPLNISRCNSKNVTIMVKKIE